jgi:hypothetical protein
MIVMKVMRCNVQSNAARGALTQKIAPGESEQQRGSVPGRRRKPFSPIGWAPGLSLGLKQPLPEGDQSSSSSDRIKKLSSDL